MNWIRSIFIILLCFGIVLGGLPAKTHAMVSVGNALGQIECEHHQARHDGCPHRACDHCKCCLGAFADALHSTNQVPTPSFLTKDEISNLIEHLIPVYFVSSQDRPPKQLS